MSWLFSRPDQPAEPRPRKRRRRIIAAFVFVMLLLGFFTAAHAVMSTRTSQGAIAWSISSITFPYVAVPAYWIFGQSKFDDYDMLVKNDHHANDQSEEQTRQTLEENGMILTARTDAEASHIKIIESLSRLPVTNHNDVRLLVDGNETFDAILNGIKSAKEYVLFQFYIVRDDDIGRQLKDALIERANNGVKVYFLYDEIGCHGLGKTTYLAYLKAAGVKVFPFNTTQGSGNRFRLNFRNHRKIVVVDGKVAFVGGLNVGDEYLGKHPTLTPWRDTHLELRGPIVQCIQAPFLEDWNWASGQTIPLNWEPEKATDGTMAAACIPTGPADSMETGTLWFLHAINSAKKRLWIVSPYFVPDEQLMSALQLAALRGVDVRVLIPQNPDHKLVYWSGLSYLQEAEKAGVKMYRYQPGFLHQKVMLIDDNASVVGTSNLDNRSMRLNFEINMLVLNQQFAADVHDMLETDFANSEQVFATEYTEKSLPYRFWINVCRLTAPVQ